MKGPWKLQLEEDLFSCLGNMVCPCPLQGNSDDEIKDNVANMVGKGWKKSQDVRLEYGPKGSKENPDGQ